MTHRQEPTSHAQARAGAPVAARPGDRDRGEGAELGRRAFAGALDGAVARLRRLFGRPRENALGLAEHALVTALAEPGCPICATTLGYERRYFAWLFLEGYGDGGVLEDFAASLGFCAAHARHAVGDGSGLSQLGGMHAFAVRRIERCLASERRRKAWEAKVVAAGGRPRPCPACRAEAENVGRAAFFLAKLIERDGGTVRYGAPGLLCLPHLRLTAPHLADATLARLLARHRAALAEVIAERRRDGAEGKRARHPQARDAALAVGHRPSLADWPPAAPVPRLDTDAVATLVADLRGPRCPVCLEVARAKADWLAWLDATARTGETVVDLLPGCPRHVWTTLDQAGRPLAEAVIDHALDAAHHSVAFALGKLEETPPRRPFAVVERLLQGGGPLVRLARGALGRSPPCPLCQRLAVARDRTLSLLAALLGERRHRIAYEAGHGLCLDHFARLIAIGPAAGVRAFVHGAQAAKLAVLGWELDECSRKSAWQWRPEPRGRERSSPRRALARFSGVIEGFDGPVAGAAEPRAMAEGPSDRRP